MQPIPVAGPSITQLEIDYVTDAVTNCWYENANVYHDRFERAAREYFGIKHAIALPTGTSAVHLALMALGVGPEDEVIVPEATWIGSSAPVDYVGAMPVFADIDPVTWCLSTSAFENAITEKTRAVVTVDLYGGMPDAEEIRRIARDRGVSVVEDAAEAFGTEYRGKKAGVFGDAGIFSFHGSKTLTTGEGGLLITDRDDIYERCLTLRDHGRRPGDSRFFFNHEIGTKYKMSSMQAALGLAQLERADELVERKREIFAWYEEELAGVECVQLNADVSGVRNSYWMTTVVVDAKLGLEKEALIEQMGDRGIACRPFFYPLSSLPAYSGRPEAARAARRNHVAYEVSRYAVNLPSGMTLTREQASFVCDALREILAGSGGATTVVGGSSAVDCDPVR